MSDQKPSVTVQRRRKGSKPTGQATAPGRPSSRPTAAPTSSSSSGYSSTPSSGYSGSSSSGGGSLLGSAGSSLLRGSTGKLGCGGIVLIIVILILFFALNKCSGGDLLGSLLGGTTDNGYTYEPEEPNVPAEPTTPKPTRAPTATKDPSVVGDWKDWLIMVYQDADDQALEQDIFLDFNEMERIGSVTESNTGKVTIVSQIDRFRGGYSSSDDFSSARRYLVAYDDNLNRIDSELIKDLGEVDMADGDTLVDFVTWAINTYPSDRYMLIMSDHGMGWPGGWSDPSPAGGDSGSAPLVRQLQSDNIYLNELDDALASIQASTGIDKLDIIGLDACLMSQMEVYAMLQPYAHIAVASEETEPGLGWAYTAFLSLIIDDTSIEPSAVAANIVETYIDQDQRITDDEARAEFLRQNTSGGGFFGTSRVSAEQLASQLEVNVTLTAVDLDQLPELNDALNTFAYSLQSTNQQAIASARSYSQSYTSIFGNQVPPSYIDLGHFAAMAYKKSGDSNLRAPAENLLKALDNAIIAERHGNNKPGSTGIAIYFPNSTLYRSSTTGMQSYTMIADRFSRVSLWDDYLAFHYTNRSFKANAAEAIAPTSGTVTRIPGAGDISISQISVSSNTVSPGGSVLLSADIGGNNIGYIYLFVGYYDPQYNSILVVDTDYLESDSTENERGVYYPVWPDNDVFNMNFDWEPYIFQISDGTKAVPALFNPVAYGATAEQAMYVVQGTYTFADTGETRKAELYFMDEKLYKVYGYYGGQEAGAPAEITPNMGDTFTISNRWMDLDASGNISQTTYYDGETLTFGSTPFTWETVYAWDGQYLVGFMVSDLDGNLKQGFTQITVK